MRITSLASVGLQMVRGWRQGPRIRRSACGKRRQERSFEHSKAIRAMLLMSVGHQTVNGWQLNRRRSYVSGTRQPGNHANLSRKRCKVQERWRSIHHYLYWLRPHAKKILMVASQG